jgi:2,4-dienoyl-CoA reductase-like NADH-dependent reductase (Old Yellow Enzyme family)
VSLFTPFTIGSAPLANRVVMAPMTRNCSPGGVPGPDVAAYYQRRARGGVGLIVTEGTWVPHAGASNEADVPDFHGEAALTGWRAVVEAVHAESCAIVPQLWHAGLIRKQPTRDMPEGSPPGAHQIGPSGIVGGFGHPIEATRAPMTLADIDAVIEAFATAAHSAHDLGFDGVALHGAHGYLIDQFLWHPTNRRTDRYGRNRAMFAAEIVAEIRRRTAPDFPILFRFSQWKSHDYDAHIADTPDDLAALLEPLAEAGVDLFDASQRRFREPAFAGSDLNLAGWAKRLTGKPSMTVGSVGLDTDFMTSLFVRGTCAGVTGLEPLLAMLDRGDFDLVAIGRGLLSDPEWPRKVREGRIGDLIPFSPKMLGSLT